MERGPLLEGPEVREALEKFRALGDRFLTEVLGPIESRELVEELLTNVCDTAVDALAKSGGHDHIMAGVESNFIMPILEREEFANDFYNRLFRSGYPLFFSFAY